MSEKKNHPSPNMPFALKSIQIEHFQGITNLKIDNIPLNAQWIFLTGENSFGKTSLLRAIARVLAGDEENNYPKESIILAEGVFKKKLFKYQVVSKELSPYPIPLATYGAARFLLNGVHQQAEERNDKKTYSLFNDDARLINIERVLIDAYHVRGRENAKKGTNTFDRLKSMRLFFQCCKRYSLDTNHEFSRRNPFKIRENSCPKRIPCSIHKIVSNFSAKTKHE